MSKNYNIMVISHGGIISGLQNTFWRNGVSTWLEHDFKVPPTGSVIAMDCRGMSENSQTIWMAEKPSAQTTTPDNQAAFYPDLGPLVGSRHQSANHARATH